MKRTLLQAVQDIVRSEFHQTGPLVLTETAQHNTCQPVTLNKSGPALALKLDGPTPPLCRQTNCLLRYAPNDRMFPLFRFDQAGLTSVCDYIIFYPQDPPGGDKDDTRLFVFLCELKSGDPRPAHQQAENGKLLADYILSMAVHHGQLTRAPLSEARGLIFTPRADAVKITSPDRNRYAYQDYRGRLPGIKFAYCRPGMSYPLSYFCA